MVERKKETAKKNRGEQKDYEKNKWGVMGTAFICERSTFPGMLQADNCEMYAIAGRNMEKAEKEDREPLIIPRFSAHHLRYTFGTIDRINHLKRILRFW